MTCEEIRALFDDYIDGLVSVQTREKIEKHLQQCESCSNELVEMKAMIEMLGELAQNDEEAIPSELHQRLCQIPQTNQRFKINYTVWGTMAAAIICVVILAVVSPNNLMSRNEMAKEMTESAMPKERSMDESKMEMFDEADAPAEASINDEEQAIQPMELTSEMTLVVDNIADATNAVVESLEGLDINIVQFEEGYVQLGGIDEVNRVLIVERLEKIGHIVNEFDWSTATLIIYIISE